MNFLLLLVTLLYAVTSCLPYTSGTPQSACSTLLPVHGGGSPQEDQPPYTVHVEKTGGNKVRVTISSPIGEEIRGFILQARSANDREKFIAGEFKSDEVSKTVDCFNRNRSTLTHTDPNSKSQITTEWTATTPVNDDIIFRATVVKSSAVYWKDVDSKPVRMRIDGQMPSSSRRKRNVLSIYDDCSESKGCFGMPDWCVDMGDCEVLFTYQRSPDGGIRFALHGLLEPFEYMAIGLSDDAIMGDDFVTECVRSNWENGRLRNSWNNGKSNGRTTEVHYNFNFTVNNGLTTCVWTRPYTINFNDRTYDLANREYYVLLAKGPVQNDRISYHSHRLAFGASVSFTDVGEVSSNGVSDSVENHATSVLNILLILMLFYEKKRSLT